MNLGPPLLSRGRIIGILPYTYAEDCCSAFFCFSNLLKNILFITTNLREICFIALSILRLYKLLFVYLINTVAIIAVTMTVKMNEPYND